MAKLTIGCFSSLVGSMSLDFAVKLAEAAVEKGHEVDFWMSGNAVMLSKKGAQPELPATPADPAPDARALVRRRRRCCAGRGASPTRR